MEICATSVNGNLALDLSGPANETMVENIPKIVAESLRTVPSSYPPAPSIAECLAFSLPALGIYMCPSLMSLIDASFVGRFCPSVELAALGPASTISETASFPLLFLSVASTNLIARAFAKKDHDDLSRVTRTSLAMALVSGVALGAVVYGATGALSLGHCGTATSLLPGCETYVGIRALALPAVTIAAVAQAVCIGTRDTRTPMVSVALAGGANLLGDFVLVVGLGMGIAGAAYATVLSQVLAAGLLVKQLFKRGFLGTPRDENGASDNKISSTLREIVSFIPYMYVTGIKAFLLSTCAATAASLREAQAAAHTAIFAVYMFCMTCGDVGSSLSQAFLPTFVVKEQSSSIEKKHGGKTKSRFKFDVDAAMPTIRQLIKCTLSMSSLVVVLSTLIIGVFGGQITNDPAVLKEMRRTLPWLAVTLSLHGSAVTLEGILLAQRKLRLMTVSYSIVAVTIGIWQAATRSFGLGLAGVWSCYAWFSASRVVAFSWMAGLLRPARWLRSMRANTQDSFNGASSQKLLIDPPPL